MKNPNKLTTVLNLLKKPFTNINGRSYQILLFILVVYAAGLTTYNYITTPKIGYIDSSIMMEKFPPAIKAREVFGLKTQAWKENTKTLENEITQLNQELVEKSGQWSKDVITKRQEEIKTKQMEYSRYGNAINKKAQELERELFEPVYAELNSKINEFGEKKGYQIIFGTLSGGSILYGNKTKELTLEFLTYVNAKN